MKKVVRTAVDIFESFRGRKPRKIKRVDFDIPEAVAVIGHVDYIGYRTTYEDKSELYEHEFQPGSRPLMCVDARGRQLVLLGGRYVFDKNHGIVDKDHKGRKVLDPEHGKDVGFMRVRQANPAKKSAKYKEGFRWGRDGYNPPTMGNSDFAAGLAAGIAARRAARAKKMARILDEGDEGAFAGAADAAQARKENPGKLRQAEVFAQIRGMGLTVKKTGFDKEIRVAYKVKNSEPSAYYTDDLEDALHTARSMANSTYRPNPGAKSYYGTDRTSFTYRGYMCYQVRTTGKPDKSSRVSWQVVKGGKLWARADTEQDCRDAIDDLLGKRGKNPPRRGRGGTTLAQIDFGQQAYRGYLIRKNSLTGQMWIEKGGHLVGRVPDQHSWEWARKEIDALLD